MEAVFSEEADRRRQVVRFRERSGEDDRERKVRRRDEGKCWAVRSNLMSLIHDIGLVTVESGGGGSPENAPQKLFVLDRRRQCRAPSTRCGCTLRARAVDVITHGIPLVNYIDQAITTTCT